MLRISLRYLTTGSENHDSERAALGNKISSRNYLELLLWYSSFSARAVTSLDICAAIF